MRWLIAFCREFWQSGFAVGAIVTGVLLTFAPGPLEYKVGALLFTMLIASVVAVIRLRRLRRPRTEPEDIVEEYRNLLVQWSSSVGTRRADRLLARQIDYVHRIVQTAEGRRSVEAMARDDIPGLRLLAAHSTFAWNAPLAMATLAALADDEAVDPVIRRMARADLEQLSNGSV